MTVQIAPKSTQHTGMALSTQGSVAAWEVTFHLDGDDSLHAAVNIRLAGPPRVGRCALCPNCLLASNEAIGARAPQSGRRPGRRFRRPREEVLVTAPVSPQKQPSEHSQRCMNIIENARFLLRVRGFLPLITVWLEVRALPGPLIISMACVAGPGVGRVTGTDIGTVSRRR